MGHESFIAIVVGCDLDGLAMKLKTLQFRRDDARLEMVKPNRAMLKRTSREVVSRALPSGNHRG
jgi:hypothetical protein